MKNISELLKKYNVPGPRYTSYPTVPYWESAPTQEHYLESVKHALATTQAGGALYIHIPFCKSLCTYCGCNTRITRNTAVAKNYLDIVLKEWAIYQKFLLTAPKISEIHLGGGTPTFCSAEELDFLLSHLLPTLDITENFEFSIEVDPRTTSKEHLKILSHHRFRRLSMGIQDFDPTVQERVNRIQSVEKVREITQYAREYGFDSINYDLIYGLPFQEIHSIETTIKHVLALKPDRIAFYGYAHIPWIKPGQRKFTEDDLPRGPQKQALAEKGRALLLEGGYIEIGMDHFALPSDSLTQAAQHGYLHRNFMGYTYQSIHPLIGLGVSAISDTLNVFMQNEKVLEKYQQKILQGELAIFRGHILSGLDQRMRQHILNLMTRFETVFSPTEDEKDFILNRLSELIGDGLVKIEGLQCKIIPEGKPFLRNVCMAFDHRLWAALPTTRIFSQTI